MPPAESRNLRMTLSRTPSDRETPHVLGFFSQDLSVGRDLDSEMLRPPGNADGIRIAGVKAARTRKSEEDV